MAFILPKPSESSGDFETAPEGTHVARCLSIVDMGMQATSFTDDSGAPGSGARSPTGSRRSAAPHWPQKRDDGTISARHAGQLRTRGDGGAA